MNDQDRNTFGAARLFHPCISGVGVLMARTQCVVLIPGEARIHKPRKVAFCFRIQAGGALIEIVRITMIPVPVILEPPAFIINRKGRGVIITKGRTDGVSGARRIIEMIPEFIDRYGCNSALQQSVILFVARGRL